MGVSRKFQGSQNKVSMLFQVSCEGISRKFQRSFKQVSGLSMVVHGFPVFDSFFSNKLQGVLWKLQGCFREISREFKRCLNKFHVA